MHKEHIRQDTRAYRHQDSTEQYVKPPQKRQNREISLKIQDKQSKRTNTHARNAMYC